MARISTLDGGPRPAVLIDFSGLDPAGVLAVLEEAGPLIRRTPPKSIDTITRTDGASFNSEVIAALKKFAAENESHVERAAIVGLTGMQKIVLSTVSHVTGRNFLVCASVEEAQRLLGG